MLHYPNVIVELPVRPVTALIILLSVPASYVVWMQGHGY